MKKSTRKIYHYTSTEALALILKTKKLRFTRLDGVDDLKEAQKHVGINFGKYFFVSCWTKEEKESIPQWNMYSKDMQGVRIELPLYPFNSYQLKPNPEITGVTWEGEIDSPLTFDEMFGSTYFIPPIVNEDFFCGDVKYVDSVEEYYKQTVKLSINKDGGKSVSVNGLPTLPRKKSQEWQFQSEYRFHLFVLPIPEGVTNKSEFPPGIGLGEIMGHSFVSNIDPGIKYIDIEMNPKVISQMVIRTGPLSTAGGRATVEALVSQWAPDAKIESSGLADSFRAKV
jgi:hypothetical protein